MSDYDDDEAIELLRPDEDDQRDRYEEAHNEWLMNGGDA